MEHAPESRDHIVAIGDTSVNNNPGASVAPSYTEDDLEVCIREAFTAAVDLGRRSLKEAHRCGYLLHEARGTADRRDGGFRGVCERCDIAWRTAYRLVELYETYPECAKLAHFTSVDAALRAAKPTPALPDPDPEPEPRPNLRIVRPEPRPAEPDPAPPPITPPVGVVQDAPEPAPAPEPPRPPSMTAQNRDLRHANGDLKAEVTTLNQGIADRDKQIQTLMRAADPETKRGISEMTDVQQDNAGLRHRNTELQTKLNESQRDATHWRKQAKKLQEHAERLEDGYRVAEQEWNKERSEMQQEIEALRQDLRIWMDEPKGDAKVLLGASSEVATARARIAAHKTSFANMQRKYEDMRRRAVAYKRLLKKNGIDVRDPDEWK